VGTLLEAVRNRTKTVDLKHVNRVLLQAHGATRRCCDAPAQLWLPEEPPERRALLVLLHALELAQHAVCESVELSEWIQRYNCAIDHMLGERNDPF